MAGYYAVEGPITPGGRQVIIETFTCHHCNAPKRRTTFDGKRLDVIRCGGCHELICQPCAETRRCMPFEKKLDEFDRIVKKTGRVLDLEKLEDQALVISYPTPGLIIG